MSPLKIVKFDVRSWLHTLQFFQQKEMNSFKYMHGKSMSYQQSILI